MKLLYLDCSMGAAGDMLCAALLELLPDPDAFVTRFNGLGIPGLRMLREEANSCGIRGSHVRMQIHGEEETPSLHNQPAHRSFPEVRAIIDGLSLDPQVREEILSIYDRIAQAEASVHGVSVDQIHFHELGSMDAIADITACCLLIRELAPERICASPVSVGGGWVRCAHGLLPVPAPAAVLLLEEIPIRSGPVEAELCTPTGAALLGRFVQSFGPMPLIRPQAVGYGIGTKEFDRANCLRAVLGETKAASDQVLELRCNLDDMSGEEIGFACEQLLEAGALDVWTQAIQMKKGRPGCLLSVLCRPEEREKLIEAIFLHTQTLGVRETVCERTVLEREAFTRDSSLGPVRWKRSSGFGREILKPEFEDLRRIAAERGLSLRQVREAVEKEN